MRASVRACVRACMSACVRVLPRNVARRFPTDDRHACRYMLLHGRALSLYTHNPIQMQPLGAQDRRARSLSTLVAVFHG